MPFSVLPKQAGSAVVGGDPAPDEQWAVDYLSAAALALEALPDEAMSQAVGLPNEEMGEAAGLPDEAKRQAGGLPDEAMGQAAGLPDQAGMGMSVPSSAKVVDLRELPVGDRITSLSELGRYLLSRGRLHDARRYGRVLLSRALPFSLFCRTFSFSSAVPFLLVVPYRSS